MMHFIVLWAFYGPSLIGVVFINYADNIYYVKFTAIQIFQPGLQIAAVSRILAVCGTAEEQDRKPNMASILIANGPNLNLLGRRQPEIYGSAKLADIEALCRKRADAHGLEIEFVQSNYEGGLVDAVQSATQRHQGIVINPAAYTHTSIAIADALTAAGLPVIEVHLSNIYRREPFRSHSYVSPVACGVICGLGESGYAFAVEALARKIIHGVS